MDANRFTTYTLDHHPGGREVAAILAAAVNAVDPAAAVRRHMRLEGDTLVVKEKAASLSKNGRVYIAAFGKAAFPMARAAAEILGARVAGGVVVTKHGHAGARDETTLSGGDEGLSGRKHNDGGTGPGMQRDAGEGPAEFDHDPGGDSEELGGGQHTAGNLDKSLHVHEAGHPVPDERGAAGAREMLSLVESAGEDDLVLCLVSGGGSALLTAPAPGMTLADLGELTGRLLASGAGIHEINTVRKHLSQVKGGRLAAAAHPARVVSLILSDVVGDDLDIIASGPTVPDPGTYADAVAVLERYRIPAPVALRAGLRGGIPETPKPGDPVFERVDNFLIGTNRMAAEAALAEAKRRGLETRLLTTRLTGEARTAGAELVARLAEMPPGTCWIAGGETTVILGDSLGMGGRNQELGLAAVRGTAGLADAVLAALATDGGDGPTDAAGAVVSGETLARAEALGLDPDDFLARHDAYHFFEPLGDLIVTGPTRTNVNDLVVLVKFPSGLIP